MYTEIKYLNLLSTRLEKFKQRKDYLWNFRCPICGDSEKNKNKVRGFVFRVKGDLLYKCHNCQYSAPLPHLIEVLDSSLYQQYRLEKFKEKNGFDPTKKNPKVNLEKIRSSTPMFTKGQLPDVTSIDSLNNSHPAKEYLLNRQLPTRTLYFTEKFKEWTNSIKPGTFEDVSNDESRIIIPFIDEKGNVFGYQGRSLSSTGLRYITILIDESKPKIFGLERVDLNDTVYIVEGPFDSLLIPNAIAMAGADVSRLNIDSDVVYVYDNEPRNEQIVNRLIKHVYNGDKIVVWPNNIKEKDINDMVLSGLPVQSIIESSVCSGLMAKLKLNDWKK